MSENIDPIRRIAEWTLEHKGDCGCDPEVGCVPCMNCAYEMLAASWLKQNPVLEPHTGMMVSLPGVLLRAAETCRMSDNSHLEHPLKELLEHMKLLREDHSKIGMFFQLYVDDRK